MIFPAPLVAHFVALNEARREAMQALGGRAVTHHIPVFSLSGARNRTVGTLDATLISHGAVSDPSKSRKWVVYMGGNGEVAEHSIETVSAIADAIGANAVAFNFRGVGRSTHRTIGAESMVEDGVAVVDYLLLTFPHLSERNILLFGHSLGGGVATQVVSRFRRHCGLVVDRSFSSLKDAASPVVPWKGFREFGIDSVFGDFNTAAAFKLIPHERRLITFTRTDRVIPYHLSSFARMKSDQSVELLDSHIIELRGSRPMDTHNAPLSFFESGARETLQRMNQFLSDTGDDAVTGGGEPTAAGSIATQRDAAARRRL